MAPSTTATSSRPTRAVKKKAPASSATSTSAGGRKSQKTATQKATTTAEGTKAPAKRGRKPTSIAVAAATAKGVSPSCAAAAATDLGISAEELAIYNKLTARMTAMNKAQKEAADLEISTRNAQLMAAELEDEMESGSEADEDEAPPAKRPRRMVLDEDEQEMASALTSLPQINSLPEEEVYMSEEEDHEKQNRGSEDEQEEDIDHGDASQDPFQDASNVDSGDWGSLMDNGLQVTSTSNNASENSKAISEDTSSTTPSTRHSTPQSTRRKSSAGGKSSGKITENSFSEKVVLLARAAKDFMRMRFAYGDVFPPTDPAGRATFAWDIIKQSSQSTPALREALKEAAASETTKKDLITFAMYGRNAIMNSIVSKARTKVEGYYQLSGGPQKIKDDVEWLIQDGAFMYGDIELQKRTFNCNKPFGSDLIFTIIKSQWFPSSSRSKSDSTTTVALVKDGTLPVSMIIFVTAAIEHSLKEYSTGKQTHFDFTEELSKASYKTHFNVWKVLETKSSRWALFWPKDLFKRLLASSNALASTDQDIDEVSARHVAKVDFSELDRIAELAEADSISPSPQTGLTASSAPAPPAPGPSA
ncbi:hypothetical protein M413DRAFT_32094 [Hebeloma cylindrosporum]|uniref:DUF6532 domain-containing protein n=1 Tax=Hebeloma cylindrosporum TaxID=76867 RepID=A0A0C3BGV3_HEBCY|nr:hypothetical protein M413DRAFT_32094 [Hebeloma cylindrosporum h7]